ncbi:SSS sodium solute transporter superfamily [Emticicia oligotrophica DSM 17448]|uniref:SSS sodium solute transporter superfamily n=2 Tax=Emticicia TaxID=312278 RepID=A0ABM5N6K0_EMTOG|nr:sodium:solute symporter [Emticicia oligotrophica]AFK05153.1 SSS sodium solute transporter superfamily [Emticicia oligotrophica DSM 17448]
MKLLDLIVFFVYMGGITVYGSSFYKKDKTVSEFTIGDSKFPSWVVTMSIFATFVSSISFLALPATAFSSNWNAFVFSLSLPIASVIAVKYFVPIYRKINSPSAYAYLETKFGLWARVYVSMCYLLTQIMRIGTILYLLALPVNAMFGWDIITIIIITGLTVTIYSLLGGIEAVMWTDAIQGIVLIGGAVLCLLFLWFAMPEGPAQTFKIAIEHQKFSLGSFDISLTESTFWVVFIYGIFINLQNFGIDQNYVQRYIASSSEKEAKKSAFWGGMMYLPVSLIFFLIGTSLFAYYEVFPTELPSEIGSASDKVFPFFIANKLPSGFTGILIASIFAAGMSTISTSINSSATVILYDYFQRFSSNKIFTEKSSIKILYIVSLILGIIGITIGIAMINVKSALDAWWKLASVFSGGMLGLFLLGAFVEKIERKGAIWGVIVGIIIILYMSISPLVFTEDSNKQYASSLHHYLTIVFGTMSIFIVGFLSTVLFKSK